MNQPKLDWRLDGSSSLNTLSRIEPRHLDDVLQRLADRLVALGELGQQVEKDVGDGESATEGAGDALRHERQSRIFGASRCNTASRTATARAATMLPVVPRPMILASLLGGCPYPMRLSRRRPAEP